MNNISFDLSGKIDQRTIDALALFKSVADSLGIHFFIVGATARDIILTHCYGIRTSRMTRDIDLGVEIANWEQFELLKKSLLSTGKFKGAPKVHGLLFDSLPIDIVPFGEVSGEDGRISWPPEHETFMSLVGFREAYEFALTIRLSTTPDLVVKLPTLAGLALMKLISWKDGHPLRQKDAHDLLVIMQKYESAGNFDRLYEKEQSLLEEEGFDSTNAGIRLLGRDMAMMASSETLAVALAILDDETRTDSQYKLVADMASGSSGIARPGTDSEELISQVEKLKQGFVEASITRSR